MEEKKLIRTIECLEDVLLRTKDWRKQEEIHQDLQRLRRKLSKLQMGCV